MLLVYYSYSYMGCSAVGGRTNFRKTASEHSIHLNRFSLSLQEAKLHLDLNHGIKIVVLFKLDGF